MPELLGHSRTRRSKTIKVYKGIEPQSIPQDVESRLMHALEKKMAAKRA